MANLGRVRKNFGALKIYLIKFTKKSSKNQFWGKLGHAESIAEGPLSKFFEIDRTPVSAQSSY